MSTPSKTYNGSCHCGVVAFTATLSPPLDDGNAVVKCNCSICVRNGYLFAFAPTDAVVFSKGENAMTDYAFNTKVYVHQFCPTCGTSLFVSAQGQTGINVSVLYDGMVRMMQLMKDGGVGAGVR